MSRAPSVKDGAFFWENPRQLAVTSPPSLEAPMDK